MADSESTPSGNNDEGSTSDDVYEIAELVSCLLGNVKVPLSRIRSIVDYACRYLHGRGSFTSYDKVALEAVMRDSPEFKEAAPYAKELAEAIYKVCGQEQSPELKSCIASRGHAKGHSTREALEMAERRSLTEMDAVLLAINSLRDMGYSIVREYRKGPGPYDLIVSKDGALYTVEVKGRWVPRGLWDERLCMDISFTENEVQYLDSRRDRHIICIVYIGDEGQREVNCVTPDEFEKRWERVHDVNAEREGRHVFRGRGCKHRAEDNDRASLSEALTDLGGEPYLHSYYTLEDLLNDENLLDDHIEMLGIETKRKSRLYNAFKIHILYNELKSRGVPEPIAWLIAARKAIIDEERAARREWRTYPRKSFISCVERAGFGGMMYRPLAEEFYSAVSKAKLHDKCDAIAKLAVDRYERFTITVRSRYGKEVKVPLSAALIKCLCDGKAKEAYENALKEMYGKEVNADEIFSAMS
ncbi:MAG: hypothetical protein RQ853_05370 [Acidianus sp.]|nr:hypothetical protein [Acidianus sp.]